MTDVDWYELFLPRGLTLDAVTAFVRPLASRPRLGLRQRTPLVVFEQWASSGSIRYLLGLQRPLTADLVAQLAAAVPGLSTATIDAELRTPPRYASDIRLTSVASNLRTDVALDVSTAQNAALAGAGDHALVVQWLIGPGQNRRHRPEAFRPLVQLGFVSGPTTSAHDDTLWRHKTTEPLFAVRGRIGTTGSLASLRGLRAAIQQTDSASGHLVVGPPSRRTAKRLITLDRPRWGGIVSGRELATVLAWPLDGGEYMTRLPVGDRPPSPTKNSRPLGVGLHPAARGQEVAMPESAITRGLFVLGPTGSGKSNLLARIALSDLTSRRSTIVIEPKGDLVDDIISRLDPTAAERAVVLSVGESEYVVGSNPLAGDDASAERRADETVAIFHHLHGSGLGPRSTDVLLHAVLLAARTGLTLPDVPVLLTDAGFRRRMATAIDDPLVLGPWLAWFDGVSDAERGQIVAPILNKLRAFTARASVRRLLGQTDPGWTWDDALDNRGIVLVSLNRGVIGPEAAALLGTLLLGQLWSAIQRRNRLPEAKRHPAGIIVDEWQLFTGGLDFADVLATCRGTGIGVALANQNMAQLGPNLRAAVAANARSRISFAPSKDDAATVAAILDSPNVTDTDLRRLGEFEAVGSMYGEAAAFHFKTEELPPARQSAASVRAASQRRFGQRGDDVDAELLQRWQQPPSGDIGRIRRGDRS